PRVPRRHEGAVARGSKGEWRKSKVRSRVKDKKQRRRTPAASDVSSCPPMRSRRAPPFPCPFVLLPSTALCPSSFLLLPSTCAPPPLTPAPPPRMLLQARL